MRKLILLLIVLLSYTLTIGQTYSSKVSYKERLEKVLEQLNLTDSVCLKDFFVEKQLSYSKSLFAMIVPKIVHIEDDYFELDSYILLVDSAGKITNKYYEPKTLFSSAVRLESIEIDTLSYCLNDNTMAFGVLVHYIGSSRPNPYSESNISLFISNKDSLVQVLENCTIADYSGEWDTNCEGQFISREGILTMSKDTTNGFSNIVVKYKYTTQTNTKVDDDCIYEENITYDTKTLKFIDGMYK